MAVDSEVEGTRAGVVVRASVSAVGGAEEAKPDYSGAARLGAGSPWVEPRGAVLLSGLPTSMPARSVA
ncbi:hypothetical protein DVH05_027293 [Phytophthora capsici]|nr:hypothetical protein DVH05_027293 [Phytophthora capsici]